MKARLLYIEPDSPLRGWAQDVLRDTNDEQGVVLMPGSRLGRRQILIKPVVRQTAAVHRLARPKTVYMTPTKPGRKIEVFEDSKLRLSGKNTHPLPLKPPRLIRPALSLSNLLARPTTPVFRISAHNVSLYSKRPSLWNAPKTRSIPLVSIEKNETEDESLKVTGTNISLRKGRFSE